MTLKFDSNKPYQLYITKKYWWQNLFIVLTKKAEVLFWLVLWAGCDYINSSNKDNKQVSSHKHQKYYFIFCQNKNKIQRPK